jgi:23S rRNA (cytosine1962-C5)-methyltransferase
MLLPKTEDRRPKTENLPSSRPFSPTQAHRTMASPALDSELPELYLRLNEDRRLSAGHLWVFSNEVNIERSPLVKFEPGSMCRVLSDRNKFLGFAYVNPRSLISARIVGRDARYPPGKSLLVHRLQVALSLRERLYTRPYYRLVYGESDELPGLVLDRFGDLIVGQIGTAGMEKLRPDIEAAVQQVLKPAALLWRNDGGLRELEGLSPYVEAAFGDIPEFAALEEQGVVFDVPVAGGQKTGWFFDQAMNRAALAKHVAGKRVLDVFSYLGAWGLTAAKSGAAEVTCVDSSASALAALTETARKNSLKVDTIKADAFDTLEKLHANGRRFDVVVIDPPAFVKRKKDLPKGIAAYRRLNQLAMQLLDRDGILVSCSCSYHLPAEDLVNSIQRAARHLNRFAQIIEVGGQAPDHPIHPAIPETRYLKAFVCRVVEG